MMQLVRNPAHIQHNTNEIYNLSHKHIMTYKASRDPYSHTHIN